MKSKANKYQPVAAWALLIGSTQFAFLTLLAMIIYPGGTHHEKDISYYDFLHNYFSDLGATTTPGGHINTTSALLFCVALSGLGLSMLIFSRAADTFLNGKQHVALSTLSTIFILLSGTSFIAVAFLPLDLYAWSHNLAAKMAFGFLMLYAAAICFMQWRGKWPYKYQIFNWAYLLIVAFYVYVLILGPATDLPSGLALQATSQKIVAYSSVTNNIYQCWGILQLNKRPANAYGA